MTDKILTFEEYTMESIKEVLNEEPQMNTDLITEMARINTDESNLFQENQKCYEPLYDTVDLFSVDED